MSLQPVLKYPLDLSGVSPNNLVVGEIQSLPETSPNRSIAPYYGAFFTEGLKIRNLGFRVFATAYENIPLTGSKPLVIGIKDVSQEYLATGLPVYIRLSNQTNVAQNGFYSYHESGSSYTLILETGGVLLTPGEQYVPTMLHQEASRVSGKEVCQLLVVTDQLVLGDLVLEYQAIGGDYSVSSDALETLIETLQLDARPVVWGEIIGLPNLFPPVEHIHHIQDFKGFGHLVDAIDDLRSLLSGDLVIGTGGTGGLTIHVGATPPPAPVLKQLWWNNETLRMFLYYEDGVGSNVWVEVSGSAGVGVGGGSGASIFYDTVPPSDPVAYPLWFNTETLALSIYFQDNPGHYVWLEITVPGGYLGPQGIPGKGSLIIACGDETTPLVVGTNIVTFRLPYGFTLTEVRASLSAAQGAGSIVTVGIIANSVDILSTNITIENGQKTSKTANIQPVIITNTLSDDTEININIEQIGDGSATGLKVYLIGTPTN